MPPVDRLKPTRGRSSESSCSVMEFMREFPDDEACLEWLWRTRHSMDGETGPLSEVRSRPHVQALQDRAAASVVDVRLLRPPRPPHGGNDLSQVVHVSAPLVLRDVPHH